MVGFTSDALKTVMSESDAINARGLWNNACLYGIWQTQQIFFFFCKIVLTVGYGHWNSETNFDVLEDWTNEQIH